MISMILAAMLQLTSGYNNAGVSGEVVAVQAATSNESATVTLAAVDSLTLYTNVTAEVISYETAYMVVTTNAVTFSGMGLPNDALPIVVSDTTTGATITIHDNSELTIDEGAENYQMAAGDVNIANFRIAEPCVITSWGATLRLTFGGVAPTEGVWPILENIDIGPISTNTVIGYVDYAAFVDTNGVSTIIGEPVRFDLPITNTVITATVPAETFVQTNTLATVATTNHFGTATISGAYIFGGGLFVDGATDGDKINIIIK